MGYGDVQVDTDVGRFAVVCLLLFTFIVIPMQAQRLAALLRLVPKHRGRFVVSDVPHIVVVGWMDYDTVQRFLAEFYHTVGVLKPQPPPTTATHPLCCRSVTQVHGPQQTRIVFMSPRPPEPLLEELLRHRTFASRTLFLQGTVFVDADLKRAGVREAKACFVRTSRVQVSEFHFSLRALGWVTSGLEPCF